MTELARALIEKAAAENAEFLDLGNCGLTEIPEEIVMLKHCLKHLSLGAYFWDKQGDQYEECENTGNENNFSEPSESWRFLKDFPLLLNLELDSCGINQIGLESMVQVLPDLEFLNISFNQIEDEGAEVIGEHLRCLSTLNASFNQM